MPQRFTVISGGGQSMRGRFDVDEWELLKQLPFQIFSLVAGADGNIDRREVAKLEDHLAEGPILRDSLHREIILALADEPSYARYVDASLDRATIFECAPVVRRLLERKLNEQERQQFLRSMFVNAMEVADSSGDKARFGEGENVSDVEDFALKIILDLYGIKLKRSNDGDDSPAAS